MNKTIIKSILYLLITYSLTFLLNILQQKVNLNSNIFSLNIFAPFIAYIIILIFYSKNTAKINIKLTGTNAMHIIDALLIPTFLIIISYILCTHFLNTKINNDFIKSIIYFLPGMIVSAFFIEIGWRTFLIQELQKVTSPLYASIISGVCWSIILYTPFTKIVIISFIFTIILAIFYSIIITWILGKVKFNIIISSIFNISATISYKIFFSLNTENNSLIMIIIVVAIPTFILLILSGKGLKHNFLFKD